VVYGLAMIHYYFGNFEGVGFGISELAKEEKDKLEAAKMELNR